MVECDACDGNGYYELDDGFNGAGLPAHRYELCVECAGFGRVPRDIYTVEEANAAWQKILLRLQTQMQGINGISRPAAEHLAMEEWDRIRARVQQ